MKPVFEQFTPLRSVMADIYDTTFDQSLRNNALMHVVEYAVTQSAGLVTSQSGDKSANGEVHRSLLLAVRGADMSVMHPRQEDAHRYCVFRPLAFPEGSHS